MRPVSIHHIIAPDISAAELVRIAGELDCPHVCLFTHSPGPNWPFPVVTDENVAEVEAAMKDRQISAYCVTSFAITPDGDVAAYEPGLARGARLGARYASVRIVDRDAARAADTFGRLGALARRYGLTLSIEFTGYKAPQALTEALAIIEATGLGAITIDPLHIVRSEASMDLMRSLPPARIGYARLCAGPLEATAEDYARESAFERLLPGEGAFPLDD